LAEEEAVAEAEMAVDSVEMVVATATAEEAAAAVEEEDEETDAVGAVVEVEAAVVTAAASPSQWLTSMPRWMPTKDRETRAPLHLPQMEMQASQLLQANPLCDFALP